MSDLISRQAAIDAMAELQGRASTKAELKGIHKAWKRINKLPPAEPKRGTWIDKGITGDWQYQTDGRGISWHEWQCDQCKDMVKKRSFYCPHCGADMRTAEQIVHDAIDNTPMAEDAYPGIKERLHKAVDDMREVTNGN